MRIPENPEAVFRAAVQRDGLPISNILKVWIDVSNHPARGKAQAAEIRKRIRVLRRRMWTECGCHAPEKGSRPMGIWCFAEVSKRAPLGSFGMHVVLMSASRFHYESRDTPGPIGQKPHCAGHGPSGNC